MPNIRVMLWAALAAILFLNYEAWMQDYPASPATGAPASSTAAGSNAPANKLGDSVPQAAAPSAAAPAAAKAETAAPLGGAPMPAPVDAASPKAGADHSPGAPVHVVTDVLDIVVSLKGGELERADLLQYPLHKDTPNVPVRLLNGDSDDLYLLQTGLTPAAGEAAPTHLATWTSPETSYSLPAGAAEIRVPLSWTDGFGLTVVKTFTFKRGSYAVDLTYDLQNDGSAARSVAAYSQFLRHWVHASRSYFDVETYSFKGPAVYDGTKARDLKVENEADGKFSQIVTNGWIASLQHHFVSAIVPQAGQPTTLKLQVQGQEYLLSATGPMIAIPAGGRTRIEEKLFIGPKLQEQLAAAGPRLDLTADYGLLTVLAHPLFVTLKWIHGLVGNWGWAIIIVTALIKLLFYPLSQASGRSMAKMRAIAPRMKQIQESYKDDREKLGRAMMELYKKEKINPLAGCLPMVVQIPFFISFYWVLLESVEMRQASFMLWVNDLSSRDPYFVLPLFMGAAMFAQFKLNPAPPDPMQAKIMQFMPLVMTGMMAWFPSGLVLYWLTNTVLSIVQQWRVNQVVQAEASKQRS
ncbi:MAG TPA: membrane protein insertase YidC [Steroidobacteraceae bacterium]|nr:membrane protein insertase YidC [Steroidobacteraceae bacterium]